MHHHINVQYIHIAGMSALSLTLARSEYRNNLPIFFPQHLAALLLSLIVVMFLPNKQMPSFIRHLQQEFYSPLTINIITAHDVLP